MEPDNGNVIPARHGTCARDKARCTAAVVKVNEQRVQSHVLAIFRGLFEDRRIHQWHRTLTAVKVAAILVDDSDRRLLDFARISSIENRRVRPKSTAYTTNRPSPSARRAMLMRYTLAMPVANRATWSCWYRITRRVAWLAIAVALALSLAPVGSAVRAEDAKPETPTWQSVLALQLRDEYRCDMDKVLFDRDVDVAGRVSKEGRARCLDGREFDFSRPSTHEKFDIRLCMPTVC